MELIFHSKRVNFALVLGKHDVEDDDVYVIDNTGGDFSPAGVEYVVVEGEPESDFGFRPTRRRDG